MKDRESRANFDALAPFYQPMEHAFAGGVMQRCRMAYLQEIAPPRRILLAGEGYGRFLQACVRAFPAAQIVVVDSSRRMLEIAQRRTTAGCVEFVHADLRTWDPAEGGFDLIVTHFLLDCFTEDELGPLIARLAAMAQPRADWLLADFRIPNSGWAAWRSRMILALLYRFFRITCGISANSLASPDAALVDAGFSRHRQQASDWGLLTCEWWKRDG